MAYLLNNDFYEGLSDAHKAILQEAIDLSIIVQNGSAMSEEFAALEKLAADGKSITVLSPDGLSKWQEVAYPIGQEFIAENVDPTFRDTVIGALEEVREDLN